MADISVTAASVVKVAGANVEVGVAGATITAGQVLYLDSNNLLQLADADASGKTTVAGIALHGASANQPLAYLTGGDLTFNAVLTSGTIYTLSDTAGGIRPAVDDNSGDTISVLGVATSTTNLRVKIHNSGGVL